MRRDLLAAAGAAWVLALGAVVELKVGTAQPLRVAVGDLLAGLAMGWAGVAILRRSSRHATGILLVMASGLWFAGSLAAAEGSMLQSLGQTALGAHRAPLALAVLWACSRSRSVLTAAIGVFAVVQGVALGDEPWPAASLAVLLVTAAIVAPSRVRRPAPAVLAAVAIGGPAAARLAGLTVDRGDVVLLSTNAALALAVVVTATTVLAELRAQEGASDHIVELAGASSLDGALAQVLRDPAVRVIRDVSSAARPDRERTAIDTAGVVVEHTPGSLDDARLRTAVTAAVAIQAEHERRQLALEQAAADLQALQRRMVVAGDEARSRIQRALERDTIPRAEQVLMRLVATPSAADAAVTLARAIKELRALARGLHPPTLATAGLRGALSELAAAAPLVAVTDMPPARYAPEVELVVYFVCAEAVANAIKHSGAMSIGVEVRERDGLLVAEVRDDGRGGATAEGGTGLAGLESRALAVAGTLRLESPAEHGTRVTLEVPL